MKSFLLFALLGLFTISCSDTSETASGVQSSPPAAQAPEESPWNVSFGKQTLNIRDFVPSSRSLDFFVNENDLSMEFLSVTPETEMIYRAQQANGKWDLSSRELARNFGRRAFSHPAFHRKSGVLYFISDVKNNETYNVYSYVPETGEIQKVTDFGYTGVFSLSPADSLIVIGRAQKLGPGGIACITSYPLNGDAKKDLVCDDKANKKVSIYPYTHPLLSSSGQLAYVQVQNGQYEKQQLVVLDVASGKSKTLPAVHPDISFIGWEGDEFRYLGKSAENKFGIYTYKVGQATPKLHFESGIDFDGWGAQTLNPKKIFVEFSLPREKKGDLSLFNFETGKLEGTIPSYDFGISDPQWGNKQHLIDGTVILGFNSRAGVEMGVLAIREKDGKPSVEIVGRAAQPKTAATPCEFENVYYETFDKRKVAEKNGDQWVVKEVPRKIHAILYKPVKVPEPAKRAAVVSAHGGPSGSASTAWDPDTQILCHLGYYVVAANPRGSTGGGESDVKVDAAGKVVLNDNGEPVYEEFVRMNENDWGGGDYSDYEMAIRYLGKTHGVPEDRVGIMGFSYGGYMTNWAATRPPQGQVYKKFSFAISGASASDLKTAVETTVVPWALTGELGEYAGNEAKYEKSSPSRFIANMNIPLFLFHGEQDNRLNFQQSKMFYDAIKAARPDANVELLILPDEGHGVKYLVNHLAKYRRLALFLQAVAPLD